MVVHRDSNVLLKKKQDIELRGGKMIVGKGMVDKFLFVRIEESLV